MRTNRTANESTDDDHCTGGCLKQLVFFILTLSLHIEAAVSVSVENPHACVPPILPADKQRNARHFGFFEGNSDPQTDHFAFDFAILRISVLFAQLQSIFSFHFLLLLSSIFTSTSHFNIQNGFVGQETVRSGNYPVQGLQTCRRIGSSQVNILFL